MTKKDTTELFDRLRNEISESEMLIITIDGEPVDVYDEETNSYYTVSIEEMDGLDAVGTFRVEDATAIVYKTFKDGDKVKDQVKAAPRSTTGEGSTEVNNLMVVNGPDLPTYLSAYPVEKINYKFNEDKILADVQAYIDSTYTKHYASSNGIQATDAIIAAGHGVGFGVGNILKYAWRLGKKGGWNMDDLMKIMHYTVITIFVIKSEGKS